MATYFVFVLAATLLSVQGAPVDVESTASASSAMHLVVKDTEDSTNYHLTPLMEEIEDIDDEITAELDTILPYINFFFDTLFNRPRQDDEGGCTDDMVIQLVPEKSSSSPELDESPVADTSDDDSSDDISSAPEVVAA